MKELCVKHRKKIGPPSDRFEFDRQKARLNYFDLDV